MKRKINKNNISGFAYAYGWNVYYEKIMGVCWKNDEEFFASQRAWGWALLMIICAWIPQTASLSILSVDLNLMINCLSTNVSIALSIVKLVVVQYQRRATGWILMTMINDWKNVRTEGDFEIMLETAKISRIISMISFSLSNVVFFDFIIGRLWNLKKNMDNIIDPRLAAGLLIDSYFPFDTTALAIFIPLWIGQFFGLFFITISYAGLDCFASMMVLHLCGQLKIIRHSLKYLVNDATIRGRDKYWQNMTAIAKRHEQLNELSFVIGNIFSSILLLQMLTCSVTFCFQGYAMFTALMDRNGASLPIFDLTFFLLYAIYTVFHLFIYCYVGDRLLVESTSLSDDFYETEWYSLSPKEAKAFLFVCLRARIPLEIKAGKFCTFNLQLFNSIMKNSMGYLSMLMAMKKRLID